MLTKYKLTNKDMQTHNGFQCELGKENVIGKPGNDLCTDQVFHYYDSPELAVLFNPIHANYQPARLFMIECDSVAHDGLKGGSKKQKFIKELPLIEFSLKQRTVFAILVALESYQKWEIYDINQSWKQWADKYLEGKNTSAESAESAESAARSAERSAEKQSRLFQSIALKVLSMNL